LLPDPEPRQQWATVFSADDHVVEPPGIFEGRFPSRFLDEVPRVVDFEGGQGWFWLGEIIPNIGLNAVAGRPIGEGSVEPRRFEHMRPGAWNVHERIRDMDRCGIWASVCFPSFLPGFTGQRLTLGPKDRDLAWAAMRAYNEWHLEAWCGAYPDRFVPQQIAWLPDALQAASEIHRNAALGFRAVSFPECPYKLGLPTIHSGYWDPFLAACEETETVLCLHIGSSGSIIQTSPDAPLAVGNQLFAASGLIYAVDWLFSGIPRRFPRIKICMSEGGIGWVASVIDRIDHQNRRYLPEEVLATADDFRRNFWFCALDDASGFRTADVIGVENILVECDYPHSDSTWPDTQALLRQHLSEVSTEAQRRICWQNGAELFRLAPPARTMPD
jgi:predicted TIM-barrel fold metal-dependent hydrolase